MTRDRRRWLAWAFFGACFLLPWTPGVSPWLSTQVRDIFIFCILAIGLNVVVGYTGLLHLGVAAFFGIGAYTTGILTVEQFPFRWGFWPAMVASTAVAGLAGVVLAAPTLRLRGDYLAIVTLGFGEVVRFAIRNLEHITKGSYALNPIADPVVPGLAIDWSGFRGYYYLSLGTLAVVALLMRNLERSKLGRAWMAVREDELAASCMGLNVAKVKLSAFAVGSALAGLAGSLYAASLDQTAPDAYTFSRSITVLVILIIGGMGNLSGAIVGTFVLMGYDNILTPLLDEAIQKSVTSDSDLLRFSTYKLIVFGLALILMMRFRPSGILPSKREPLEAM